jgi:hypothetical protein
MITIFNHSLICNAKRCSLAPMGASILLYLLFANTKDTLDSGTNRYERSGIPASKDLET